jgi:hypothetical protein
MAKGSKRRRAPRCGKCGEVGHYRTTCPSLAKVFIVWIPEDVEAGVLHTLTSYHGTRVYVRDNYDPRLDLGREGLPPRPYFTSLWDALEHMAANPGTDGTCQVDVRLRGEMGWSGPFNEYLAEGVATGLDPPARSGIIE